MTSIRLSKDYLPNFHDKEASLEKITDDREGSSKIWSQVILLNILALIYSVIMGCYNGFLQALSSGIKLPVLFNLLILICFPAFFVVQSVLGSKLTLTQMINIILSGFVYMTSIMASFSTIVLFFLITGDNYAFIKLLHVAIFTLSGLFGIRHIVDALQYSCEKKKIYPKTGVMVFRFWIFIMFFVGAQLSWSFRPLIGSKEQSFEIFREKQGNFYQEVFRSFGNLIS